MGADPAAKDVEQAGIFEFLYRGNVAQPGPAGECYVDGCEFDAWVRTRTSGWLCVRHFQEQYRAAIEQRVHEQYRPLVEALGRRQKQGLLAHYIDPDGRCLACEVTAALASLKEATDGE